MSETDQVAVRVEKNGDLYIDDIKTEIVDLTQERLEDIVDKSLEGRVLYQIEGEMPIAKFFATLKEGTSENSELRKMKDKMDKSQNSSSFEDDSSNTAAVEVVSEEKKSA